MKAENKGLFVGLFLICTLILLTNLNVFAGDSAIEEDIWAEETTQLSEDKAVRIMKEVEAENPELAKQLKELWESDKEQFMQKLYENNLLPRYVKNDVIDEQKLNEDFVTWLQANFEDEAKDLQSIKEKNPQMYDSHLALCKQQYSRIMETERRAPQLAEVMKEDVRLTKKRGVVLAKISKSKGQERDKLIDELKQIVDQRFDIIIKKKQLRYESLAQRVEWLAQRIEENKAETQKLIEKKDEKTKQRLEELLSEAEQMNWQQ